jgi:hypothetical protein
MSVPDWCSNTLRVRALNPSGSRELLERFVERVTTPEGNFSFELIRPLPEESFAYVPKAAHVVRDGEALRMARRIVTSDGDVVFEDEAFVADVVVSRFGDVTPLSSENEWRFATAYFEGLGDSKLFDRHWGTKWDAHEVQFGAVEEAGVSIRFTTAWSPPVPVVVALQALLKPLGLVAELNSIDSALGVSVVVGEDGTVVEVGDLGEESDWLP